MELREATPEERRIYYTEEWSPGEIPDFLVASIAQREFGFDHDGTGPKDRYNAFPDVNALAGFLRERAPYSAYSSVSYYERPGKREGYLKAELVFDIDAKDLPQTLKKCCKAGEVCEKCLDIAKTFILTLKDIFEGDFGLKNIHYVYSGRGYHVRILDPDVMDFTDVERAYILDYLTGSQELKGSPKVDRWLAPRGYTRVFKDRLLMMLEAATAEDLMMVEGIGKTTAEEVMRNKEQIMEDLKGWKNFAIETDKKTGVIRKRRFKALKDILGEARYDRLTDFVLKQNASMLDAKVTVDVKRILRLPSSLHSKAGLKCMLIGDLESFNPLRDAVPRFVAERRD
ncbi:MAG: DNA primase catalytic subunit PriS [Methanobacteriota archaeon]|nr:MAG: DNA primase catalytic subunit PriS [Euryarchaeota archaeon]